MKYKIACVGDIHWGALDADKQRKELSILPEYLSNNKIDLLVICGDYFDHKLLLNSQASLQAIDFMNELRHLSIEKSFKIRVFDGTRSHDYDQLEVFMPFDNGDTFRVFRHTTQEETLPEMKCLYVPDENIDNDEWYREYGKEIMDETNDIMFFHGNFDNMLGGLLTNDEVASAHNVIFEYSVLSRIFSVMIGGHWHDADSIGNMHYTRSINRWKFGEDRPKGFIVCDYDTSDRSYEITRIDNPYTDEYKTYLIDTSIFTTLEDYNKMTSEIDKKLKDDSNVHIKIKIVVTNDSANNKVYSDHIKTRYSMDRRVKVSIENKFVKQKKKEKKKSLSDTKDKFSFLFDSGKGIEEKFIEFIKLTKGIELDINEVREILTKYTKRN